MRIFLFTILLIPFTPNIFAQEFVGNLIAYYAKDNLNEAKKGRLIVDSNDPIDRIVDYNKTMYKFEGNYSDTYYSSLLPKSKVLKKTYKMSTLPVALVKKESTFISKNGYKARIFWSNINGHKYYNFDGSKIDSKATQSHKGCYVLSVTLPTDDNNTWLFEEQLKVEGENIRLYQKNRFAGENVSKKNVRYRPGKIGIIEEEWFNPESYGDDKSAYSLDGKLLVDQYAPNGIPDYISIAYIAELNALYIDGYLFYKQ